MFEVNDLLKLKNSHDDTIYVIYKKKCNTGGKVIKYWLKSLYSGYNTICNIPEFILKTVYDKID